MTEYPLVSVLAVCYNHARFVVECLDGIRNQSYPNIEIIIVDDCSKDDSVAVINNWIKQHQVECRFIAHSENQGVCRTLNDALGHAQGKYISLIATDDAWLPDKITRQVAIMETMPETVGILYSDAYQVDENGQQLADMFIAAHCKCECMPEGFKPIPEGDILERLIFANFIPAMTTLIRRSVYDKVGLYDENLLYEDWDFWLRAANHFHFAYSDYPSANYRILSTSMMRTVLSNRNVRAEQTFFLINSKILGMHGISQLSRSLTVERLSSNARFMYTMNHPDASSALFASFTATREFLDLYFSLLAFIGISENRYHRIKDYLQWRLSGFLSLLKK
ncbi:MAG: glycosyltransferase [Methylococcaceae bacterium]|nr:glycosyltransferase [Methylococcaceae bacterium]